MEKSDVMNENLHLFSLNKDTKKNMNDPQQQFPPWCHDMTESSTSHLHESALSFLDVLGLSKLHPFCLSSSTMSITSSISLAPQDQNVNDLISLESKAEVSIVESMKTLYWQVAPALLAMGELWLRLFAFLVAPLCICYFLSIEIYNIQNSSRKVGTYEKMAGLFGLASAAVFLTDALYVLEYGRSYGAMLFGLMLILSHRSFGRIQSYYYTNATTEGKKKTPKKALRSPLAYRFAAMNIIFWTTLCILSSHPSISEKNYDFNLFRYLIQMHLNVGPHTKNWARDRGYDIGNGMGLDLPTIEPGFYYNPENPLMNSIAQHWPEQNRRYELSEGGNATPWLVTGDSRTGIPFLIHKIPPLKGGVRVWVPSEKDIGDANAMDIFFPEDGIYRHDYPVYLVLHGLNGGSDEEYIQDFIHRRRKDGATVIVLIARGLMKTPVVGWNVFHGARVDDVDVGAKAIKAALAKISQSQSSPPTTLAGVGFSMGAIILSNYVARSGANCHLDAAVALSGGLNMREQLTFYRSMRLWQPMLAKELRNTVVGGFRKRYQSRLTPEEFLEFMRSSHITSIDQYAVVQYNKFEDLTHYYSEMSAMGEPNRISQVSVPFLVIQALDDPLISWRTLGDPKEVVNSGSGNIMMLLTKSGGHVGWPLGMNPKAHGWKWMNNCASDFVVSLHHVKKQNSN